VRAAVGDTRIDRVVAVSRRPLTRHHSRLPVAIHRDFMDFTPPAGTFASVDGVLCALGIS